MSPVLWVLLVSLAANGALGWAWLGARDDVATVTAQKQQAVDAAKVCSDNTKELASAAEKMKSQAKVDVEAAYKLALESDKRGQGYLRQPPSQPGNDCASAQDRVRRAFGGKKP